MQLAPLTTKGGTRATQKGQEVGGLKEYSTVGNMSYAFDIRARVDKRMKDEVGVQESLAILG